MKKLIYPLCSLLILCVLPLCSFAEESASAGNFQKILDVIWYVILAVLFGGGLILVSKWSKKINERDRALQEELEKEELTAEEEASEEDAEENAQGAEEEQSLNESE